MMKNYGFIRTAAASISTRVANPSYNVRTSIKSAIEKAIENEVSIVVFPELCVSGYSCGDLFCQNLLLRKCEEEIAWLTEFSFEKDLTVIVGTPVRFNGRLYDCAVVIKDGEIKGIVPAIYIPSDQSRWVSSGSDLIHGPEMTYAGFDCIISPNQIFELGDASIAVQTGNDLLNPIPQCAYHALAGAQVIATLAAGNETVCTARTRDSILASQSLQTISTLAYASANADSSQDHVFTGHVSIWENGTPIQTSGPLCIADIDIEKIDTLRRKSGAFRNVSPDGTPSASYDLMYHRTYLGECRTTDLHKDFYGSKNRRPFIPAGDTDRHLKNMLNLQVSALAQRLNRINAKAVIGISGGLDSTLALIVTVLAFDRSGWSHEGITAITMPGFGTTSRTKDNAWDLMQAFGVTSREISIAAACEQHFSDIGHSKDIHDATYENTQARERTQILMDIANQVGGIVIGTGDLSELALGWATYNGDHRSMYGVNADVPKTLVRSLVAWAAENEFKGITSKDGRSVKEILSDILDTPISPELLPASEKGEIQQVTEDLVGPYELHDFFLYNFAHYGFAPEKIFFLAQKTFDSYDDETIRKWLKTFIRRFFSQQFKRSCMPDGPKVCEISLSPRGDWHMSSDAWSDDFLEDITDTHHS